MYAQKVLKLAKSDPQASVTISVTVLCDTTWATGTQLDIFVHVCGGANCPIKYKSMWRTADCAKQCLMHVRKLLVSVCARRAAARKAGQGTLRYDHQCQQHKHKPSNLRLMGLRRLSSATSTTSILRIPLVVA